MALTVDLHNLTDFSFTNVSDGSELTPTSRFSSNDKRAVTHIFVSQNALAALVQSCQKSDIVTWSILLKGLVLFTQPVKVRRVTWFGTSEHQICMKLL